MEYGIEIRYLCCLYGRPLVVFTQENWNGLVYQKSVKLNPVDVKAALRYI